MAVHTPLKVDHQVLGEEFCSGYMDPFGNWNTGFPCPHLEDDLPGLCCGMDNLKYCCNGHGPSPRHIVNDVQHLPLVMGIVFGVSVAMVVSVVVCCFKCSCCLLYKKRQPHNTGPLYHLHCSSAGSGGGVANMYSFSTDATPQETPRSSNRSGSHRGGSSNRWSTITADSGPGLLNMDHHLSLLENASSGNVHASFRPPHNLSNALVPQVEEEELPPPYNANHSTLVAVRTNQTHQGQHSLTSNDTNSNSRISSISTSTTNNHPGSHTRTPPPTSLPSSTSNTVPQGFPTFLHNHHNQQQQQQQNNLNSIGAPSPRPKNTQSHHLQRHSIASGTSEDSFIHGFSTFPPPPSETTAASPAVTVSNIFSLAAPPPPSFTRQPQQSHSLHHNHPHPHHQQQQNNHITNWHHHHHQRSSSLYNPLSTRTSSSCSNGSGNSTFAPVLSPTRRPCSTAHIVHMQNQHPLPEQHMFTATKF